MRALLWHSHLESSLEVSWAELQLQQAGLKQQNKVPHLVSFEDSSGHQILWIPRTGRIQIRLHYLTPQEERKETAFLIFGRLEEAWRQDSRGVEVASR